MGDGTEPLMADDASWLACVHEATSELAEEIDAALIRCATGNSTYRDAILLAGFLNRGHLFETKINGRVTPTEEDAE
jgi:hypothetical protein